MEKCIGCELCAGVCPADCIYVRGLDNPPDDPVSPGERYGFVYEINYLRCIHCDLCVEACPTEAITESKLFEFSFTNRADAIYTKDELVVGDDGRPQQLPWEDWRVGDDLHTSGWMRATSPSGAAAYEGRVQWSGELGYGVRPPEGGQSGHVTTPPPGAFRSGRSSSPTCSSRTSRSSSRGCGAGCSGSRRRWSSSASGGMPPSSDCRGPVMARSSSCRSRWRRRPPGASPPRRSPHDGSARGHGSGTTIPDAHHLRHLPRPSSSSAAVGRGHLAQPGPRRADARHDAVRRGRALRRAAGRLPGRRPGHRLRRRHRRPVPLRDHVPRRRPRGEHRGGAPAGSSAPWPSCWWPSSWWACSSWWPTPTGRPGPTRRPARPPARAATCPSSASRCSPPTCSPSRSRPGLLVIAVVGAVVLARRPARPTLDDDDEAGEDAGPGSEDGQLEESGRDLPAGPAAEDQSSGGAPAEGGAPGVGDKDREEVAP